MTAVAHKQKTPRIRIQQTCFCNARNTLPAGTTLELLPGDAWPPQVLQWIETGAAVPLDPAISVSSLSRVGKDHFAAWFSEVAPTPAAADPPMTTAAICKMYGLTAAQFEWCREHPSFPTPWFPGEHNLATSVITRIAMRDAGKVRAFFEMGRAIFGGR